MFDIGDRIVYPMHGAGTIEDIETKEILGEETKYYMMKLPIGEMKVMVPVANVEEIGIREIISADKVDDVIEILKKGQSDMPQNWNRRFRENNERIKTGDIEELAAVVRNLTIMDWERGLSTGEKKMLSSANQMLSSEIVLATEMELEKIENMIEEAIESGSDIEKED